MDYINRKWYQEAVINGKAMPTRRKEDTNEKRWKNLIEPLLPSRDGKDRLFIELGSNAGFYLRKMADLGFKTIGIEKEDEFVAQAKYWEENDPKGTETIQADLREWPLRASYIVLLANVHYWLTPDELKELIHWLIVRSMYVIVIGRFRPMRQHKSDCRLPALLESFDGWVQGKVTEDGKHYGTIFRNPIIIEREVSELEFFQKLMKSKRFYAAFAEMVEKVLSGEITKLETGSKYYRYLQWRNDKTRRRRFVKKIKLIKSVAEMELSLL